MTIPKDNTQLENARRLRREMTPHERKLWYLFLRRYPVKIYKQRIIGRFIVDFYCASARLVIELDGSQHYEPQGLAYDAERSQFLMSLGLGNITEFVVQLGFISGKGDGYMNSVT